MPPLSIGGIEVPDQDLRKKLFELNCALRNANKDVRDLYNAMIRVKDVERQIGNICDALSALQTEMECEMEMV